ncbi:MAG: hypothetical protein H6585_14300 [Flavobacteriales bacterium]|nr:hypothetical protein [Flavobacteriales bacterium]MCB9449501.1 hypothetical protein [Flavobacteriales bacterium]
MSKTATAKAALPDAESDQVQNPLEIGYGQVLDRFRNHIAQKHNRHIFFSAKYGVGKSTFLEQFFKINKDEYYAITLKPVNYVVSSNESIFELIKVDIIKHLYNDDHIDFEEKLKVDTISAGISYIKNRPLEFVKHLLSMLAKLDPIMEVMDGGATAVYKLIQDFSQFEERLNKKLKTDGQQLADKAYEQHFTPGTYYEFDLISRILKETITSIKDKQTVLVIDDLDRLDPDHIFRILNIFSAHNNHREEEHKFGFKKVILVGDIDNIRCLFQHRYGSKADFGGYMDKFYSDEIFSFSNADIIRLFVTQELETKQLNKSALVVLRVILENLVKANLITVRQIMKYRNFSKPDEFSVNRVSLDFLKTNTSILIDSSAAQTAWLSSDDMQILYIISFFSSMFGSLDAFQQALNTFTHSQKLLEDEHKECFVEVFALMHRISQELEDNGDCNIYFDFKKDRNQKLIEINKYPTGTCFKLPYRLQLIWNKGNRYTGNTSYFKDFKVIPLNLGEITKIKIPFSDVCTYLKHCIQYINQQGFATSLNISS